MSVKLQICIFIPGVSADFTFIRLYSNSDVVVFSHHLYAYSINLDCPDGEDEKIFNPYLT